MDYQELATRNPECDGIVVSMTIVIKASDWTAAVAQFLQGWQHPRFSLLKSFKLAVYSQDQKLAEPGQLVVRVFFDKRSGNGK